MSSHSNATEAHAFYYQGVDGGEAHSYSGCTLSYRGDTAYSYSTAVAKVIPTRKYERPVTGDVGSGLTLVPCYTISATTAKHVSLLREASPFDVVAVPVSRGGRDITPRSVRDGLLAWLESTAKGLNKKGNRQQFHDLLEARGTLLERAGGEWAEAMRDKAFGKYTGMDVSEIAREIQARNRVEAAKQAQRTKETYRKYLDGKHGEDYLAVVRAVFDWGCRDKCPGMSEAERGLLQRKLGSTGSAFVWLDEDGVRTSRHVTVPLDAARVAMKAWQSGRDMRAFKVGPYSVVRYEGGEVQIGCHRIPKANMLALFEAVTGRPFDEARAKAGCASGSQMV